jgi:voltage-gated potassium channel
MLGPIALERRLLRAAALLLSVHLFGVVGYIVIEGWSLLDALYMTVISITTVGFTETHPLSDGGRIFTIFLILSGVGAAFYILTSLVALVLEGELRLFLGVRTMKRQIDALRDHYILCGFGRVGEEIAREFEARRIPFVIVESLPESLERCRRHDYPVVEGDATSDAVLLEAGIERARCLLAASDSDSGNTYIVLSAKALNPRVFVVARVGQLVSEERVRRAGADRVISPYSIGGRRMALSALQPLVVDFIDTLVTGRHGEQVLAEVEATEESGLPGMTIEGCFRACPDATLLALQKPTGSIHVGPRGTTTLAPGDRLIVLGTEEELKALGPRPQAAEPEASTEEPSPERA